jgi:predicted NUDIX family NTP pyrophosphohydrolase
MAAQKKTSRRSMLSAGILAYRKSARELEVLLVHPGGPFWRKKDSGAWSIPKGEMDGADDPEQAARREFAEELGPSASIGPLQALGEVRQLGGKRVIAFAGEADFDPARQRWPARRSISSGRPEAVDDRTFPKSIARSGLTWSPLDRRCCPRRWTFSIAFWQLRPSSTAKDDVQDRNHF